MDIKKLVELADYSKASKWHTDFEEIISEFGLSPYTNNWKDGALDSFDEKIKSVRIYTWICTDTEVGIFAYFFEENVVCFSFQTARKMPKNYYWASTEAAQNVHDFIKTLLLEEENTLKYFDDFNESGWNLDAIISDLNQAQE